MILVRYDKKFKENYRLFTFPRVNNDLPTNYADFLSFTVLKLALNVSTATYGQFPAFLFLSAVSKLIYDVRKQLIFIFLLLYYIIFLGKKVTIGPADAITYSNSNCFPPLALFSHFPWAKSPAQKFSAWAGPGNLWARPSPCPLLDKTLPKENRQLSTYVFCCVPFCRIVFLFLKDFITIFVGYFYQIARNYPMSSWFF